MIIQFWHYTSVYVRLSTVSELRFNGCCHPCFVSSNLPKWVALLPRNSRLIKNSKAIISYDCKTFVYESQPSIIMCCASLWAWAFHILLQLFTASVATSFNISSMTRSRLEYYTFQTPARHAILLLLSSSFPFFLLSVWRGRCGGSSG